MSLFLYRMEVEDIAGRHGLHPDLIHGLCVVESSGNPHAWNPEPHYRYLWDVKKKRPFRRLTPAEQVSEGPPEDFPTLAGDRDQEWWGQQASWGLMQVMGAVAREYGFQEPYLPQLCVVRYGLEFGCTYLASRLLACGGDLPKALATYNAGPQGAESPAGTAYALKVLRARDAVQRWRLGQ